MAAAATSMFEDASRVLTQILEAPNLQFARPLSSVIRQDSLPPVAEELRRKAVELFNGRRRRQDFFARAIFNEPAWDILLALYIRAWSQAPFSIAALSHHVGTPPSSTLRWVGYLTRERLIERIENPGDKRKGEVRISIKGWRVLNDYLQGEIG